MTETRPAQDRPRDGDRPPIEYRRTAYHQFVEEDRERMDQLSADLQAITQSINDLAMALDSYMREWRERR